MTPFFIIALAFFALGLIASLLSGPAWRVHALLCIGVSLALISGLQENWGLGYLAVQAVLLATNLCLLVLALRRPPAA